MRGNWIVAWYELDRAYGGPEEGGWYYDCGQLVRPFAVAKSRDQARKIAARANGLMRRLQRGHRDIGSVLYSGGRYEAFVFERHAPRYWPEQRPHYE